HFTNLRRLEVDFTYVSLPLLFEHLPSTVTSLAQAGYWITEVELRELVKHLRQNRTLQEVLISRGFHQYIPGALERSLIGHPSLRCLAVDNVESRIVSKKNPKLRAI